MLGVANGRALYNNALRGTIPTLAELSQLTVMNLGANSLSGTIPSLAELSQLTSLHFDTNTLSGTVPTTLGELDQLTSLCAAARHSP